MTDVKFSIIVPAYKAEYLSVCIQSILAQDYGNWQLVIANDCSPYDLDSVVGAYDDARILYYKREKGYGAVGLAANWNECLSHCVGDYVLCMGDDDLLAPGCLFEFLRLIALYPECNVFHGWTKIIDDEGRTLDIMQKHPKEESVYGLILRQWRGDNYFAGSFVIRRAQLVAQGGYKEFPLAWGTDHITAYEAAAEGGVISTSRVVFLYRQHPTTLTSSRNHTELKIRADREVREWFEEFLSRECPDETGEELRRILQHQLTDWYYRTTSKDLAESYARCPLGIVRYATRKREFRLTNRILGRAFLLSIYMFLKAIHG